MFVKIISKETLMVTILETESIKLEYLDNGNRLLTLLPKGKVIEFIPSGGQGQPEKETTFEYPNEVYLMNNEGTTIDTLIS